MKNKFLLLLLLGSVSLIKAQATFGVQAGVSFFLGATASPVVGLLWVNNASIREDGVAIFQYSFNYHFPFTMKGSDYAYPIGNNNGSPIDLAFTNKISLFDFHTCGRIYFGDNSMEDGGFYGLIGITLGYARITITPGPYDQTKYTPGNLFSNPRISLFQPYVDLGFGYDKVLDNDQVLGAQFLCNIGSKKFNSYPDKTGTLIYVPSFIGIRGTYSFSVSY